MQEPQITTIIPTYRRPRMLRRAIRSVLAQTYPHFQVMVLDNASGDETPQVVAELAQHDSRVKYHCHPENIGALANFDYGMRYVETPRFSFLADDDVVLPHFYETVLKGFEEHPDAMFSAGLTIKTFPGGPIGHVQMIAWRPGRYDPPTGAFEMHRNVEPNWTAILFRREVLEEVGYLASNVLSSDTEFEFRIALRFPFVVSLRPCAFRVRHPGSRSETRDLGYVWPGRPNMIRNLTEDGNVDLRVRKRLRSEMIRSLVRTLILVSIRAVRRRRFDEAYEAGRILRKHFGKAAAGSLVQLFARVAPHVPGAVPFLNAFHKVRASYKDWCSTRRMMASERAIWEEASWYLRLTISPE